MQDNDAPPDIAEQYASATNTSNLRMEMDADRRSNADILVAAGWSKSRIGTALMRLHTHYDTSGLEKVQIEVAMQANAFGIESPDSVASAVVGWWLSKVCKTCRGRKFELIPNTPALSVKHCRACRGTGEARLPFGDDGRILANWLDDCKQAAVTQIRARLHGTRGKS